MNIKTIAILCKINNDFYQTQGESFSQTRHAPWLGWQRCLAAAELGDQISVFDLACGNLRFLSFLQEQGCVGVVDYYAIDNADGLVSPALLGFSSVHYESIDVLGALQKGQALNDCFVAPPCDLSVSFGFMHHVPSSEFRKMIISALVKQTRPGGYVIVSFWQFLNNPEMGQKARITHEKALKELNFDEIASDLEENDFLIGWQDKPEIYRYCHSFSDGEIDALVHSVAESATLIDRFYSDGRSQNLNTYVVLKVA